MASTGPLGRGQAGARFKGTAEGLQILDEKLAGSGTVADSAPASSGQEACRLTDPGLIDWNDARRYNLNATTLEGQQAMAQAEMDEIRQKDERKII